MFVHVDHNTLAHIHSEAWCKFPQGDLYRCSVSDPQDWYCIRASFSSYIFKLRFHNAAFVLLTCQATLTSRLSRRGFGIYINISEWDMVRFSVFWEALALWFRFRNFLLHVFFFFFLLSFVYSSLLFLFFFCFSFVTCRASDGKQPVNPVRF